MDVSDKLHNPVTLPTVPPGQVTKVGPTVDLDSSKENLCPCRESNPDSLVIHL
jgi:hypothetical protein